MFDLSKEFDDFYTKHTVLPQDIKNDLREKKKLNLDRLDSGLDEYNSENSTAYRGQIIPSNRPNNKRKETTDFFGPHFVECYVIKNGVCVARARIDVPIE